MLNYKEWLKILLVVLIVLGTFALLYLDKTVPPYIVASFSAITTYLIGFNSGVGNGQK